MIYSPETTRLFFSYRLHLFCMSRLQDLYCLEREKKATTFIQTLHNRMDFFIDIFLHIDQHLVALCPKIIVHGHMFCFHDYFL